LGVGLAGLAEREPIGRWLAKAEREADCLADGYHLRWGKYGYSPRQDGLSDSCDIVGVHYRLPGHPVFWPERNFNG